MLNGDLISKTAVLAPYGSRPTSCSIRLRLEGCIRQVICRVGRVFEAHRTAEAHPWGPRRLDPPYGMVTVLADAPPSPIRKSVGRSRRARYTPVIWSWAFRSRIVSRSLVSKN